MKILMTNNALEQRAGSESYLETVAVELRQLGHEPVLYSPQCGKMAHKLRQQGFDVYDEVTDLPRDLDVIHGQHVSAVGRVRARFPRTPMVFATHSWVINPLEDPVPELAASAFVVFNELTESRFRAHAGVGDAEIVRLTQPVSTSFADGARVPVRSEPTRAVAVSRRLKTMPSQLDAACAARGLAFEWIGGPDSESADAREEMRTADIVFAIGRTALEAMAAARAVIVLDEATRGGWVTEKSYPRLEADGFTGVRSGFEEVDLDSLLAGYDPAHGLTARRLAVRHHGARQHAISLVELYVRMADVPVGRVSDPLTIARLAKERTALELRAVAAEWTAAELCRDLAAERHELDVRLAALTRIHEHNRELAAELEKVRAQRDRARTRRQKLSKELKAARDALARAETKVPGEAQGPADGGDEGGEGSRLSLDSLIVRVASVTRRVR